MFSELLSLHDLTVTFRLEGRLVTVLDKVSLSLAPGRTLGLVGESGCGKSMTALALLRLVPHPPGEITGGRILWKGRDLRSASAREIRGIRGGEIAMIFQEPMTSLNPVFTVGQQIVEALRLHRKMSGREARAEAISMLGKVRIPSPEVRVDAYPHQLSGGMRQRIMIAMALSCRPALLIADEPTTALDVTIQAQILDLLQELQREFGMAMLLITHALGVVAETADEVAVMYAGRFAEQAATGELFAHPLHPYTRGLLKCLPDLAPGRGSLATIPGSVPSPLAFPEGCRFRDRCSEADAGCSRIPAWREVRPGHSVACWKAAAT